jgi:hypothetical protein
MRVTESTVRRWINGSMPPNPERIAKIYELSGGRVTPTDVLDRPSPRMRPGRPPRSGSVKAVV